MILVKPLEASVLEAWALGVSYGAAVKLPALAVGAP